MEFRGAANPDGTPTSAGSIARRETDFGWSRRYFNPLIVTEVSAGDGFCIGRFDTVEAFCFRECSASTRPPRNSFGRQTL